MKIRTLFAALIFLGLTALKFAMPDESANLRDLLMPAAAENVDYRAKATDLGRVLSGGGVVYVGAGEQNDGAPAPEADAPELLNIELPPLDIAMPELIEIRSFVERFRPEAGSGSVEVFSFSEPEEIVPAPLCPQEARREAFLASQEAFAGHELPDNVSLDIPALPFETARPGANSIGSGFGFRIHPIFGDVRFHFGSDFSANHGDSIYAFADGVVIAAQDFDGYGLTVIIEHAEGFTTLYAHCSQILVRHGEKVSAGQLIALAGNTGRVTGPHLHFELMKGDVFLNPEFYIF